ncbi:flavodoxin [uncultured Cyclobacterium sp.]|uniref:flavodoxin family protein n=1 Tax=uncultured Cyclobacterium sp. TaxID=453820 RepID=UPI0030EC4C42|tara:strand:- start:18110 stop:18718 length:609 start_codon:yes stop_codon:yes gene_type:complete
MRLFLLFIYLTSALSCSSQTQSEALYNPGEISLGEILIVYLSRTKNTKAVAEMIQEKVGGALVSLELETPYPEDYDAIVAQVAKENETGILPPLETEVDVSQYRTVFVGFPTWGMQLPPPMKTFLSENDLSGKMVIPFNTNAGYGIGSSFDKVEELCPESTILEGYSTRGGIERDGVLFVMEGEKEEEVKTEVDAWLGRLGF